MRNLKRALSLTLASVMLLGMMVFGTSAVSYSDADSITNVEAVDVMNASEIMLGSGGKFMPNQTVTRAQMAIIVIKMLYGSDMNVKQFEGETNFTDVPANAYYSGYVNLASQLGIINGYGNGKFGPAAPVTTAQAALMLTKALGYFQDNSELGDSWVLSAITKATEIGLFGDLKLDRNAGLRRDDVAEMTFNAITGTTPVAKNEIFGYYTVGGALTSGVQTGDQAPTLTLGWKIHDLTTDDKQNHGEAGHVWINRKSNAVLTDFYSTDDVLGSSTDGTVISKLTNKSESKFQAELDTTAASGYTGPAFYYNGTQIGNSASVSAAGDLYVDNNTVKVAAGASAAPGTDPEYTVKGAIVTFRDIEEADGSYDGKAEIVTIVEKSVIKLSRDVVTEESGSITRTKYAIGSVVDAETNVEYIHGYEGLKKDDIVLAVALAGGEDGYTHYYLELAGSETGKVTKFKNDNSEYTLDNGKVYKNTQLTGGNNINTSDAKLNAEVQFFLDDGGYVVYTKLVDEAEANYAVVVDYDDRTMEGQKTKLLLADGTHVTVNADYMKVISGVDTVCEMVGSGGNDSSKTVDVVNLKAVVEYTIEGGVYKLKAVSAATDTDEGTVSVGQVKKNTLSLTGSTANDATVFIIRDANGGVSRYVGIANVPDVDSVASTGAYMGIGKGSTANYVFVTEASSSLSSKELFFVVDTDYQKSEVRKDDGTVDKNLVTYQVFKNGEIIDLTCLASVASTISTNTGAYEVTAYDGEYVKTVATAADPYDTVGTLLIGDAVQATEYKDNVLTVGSTPYRITEDTKVVKVDKDNQTMKLGDVADILATSTTGEKASLVKVVNDKKDDGSALTDNALVVFIFDEVTVAAPYTANVTLTLTDPADDDSNNDITVTGSGATRTVAVVVEDLTTSVEITGAKTAAQTVTVKGTDATKVTPAGTNIAPTYTVDTTDAKLGGTVSFSLEVTETGKSTVTYNVTVTVATHTHHDYTLDGGKHKCADFATCGDPGHTPAAAGEWSADLTNHWHACTGGDGCDFQMDEAAHSVAAGGTWESGATCENCSKAYDDLDS